ncbi:acyltransferase, partial [Escherichia coli]|nr:acyltransferase [Escherichia coli]
MNLVVAKKYRGDIDGLRAIAVLGVIFFHIGLSFPGGFVGVDVFFVISGYLITRNITGQLESNAFSFGQFYTRRALRLLPALFFVSALSLIAAMLLFSPQQMIDFGKSLIFAVISLSNFFFWLSSDYFDASSITKPLLHTWSLSVEEQFYLVWPLLLTLAYKLKSKNGIIAIISIMFVVSIIYSQSLLPSDSNKSYFLTTSRAFEFAVGAIVVFLERLKQPKGMILNVLYMTGIAIIIISMFMYNETTQFPGVMALIPCIGAGMAIYAGNAKVSVVTDNKVAIYIGLISYSLYLVHWPVIVFYNYYIATTPDIIDKIAMIIITAIFSLITFYGIEKTFRLHNVKLDKFKIVTVYSCVGSIIAILIFAGKYSYESNGMTWRVNEKYVTLAENAGQYHFEQYGGHGYGYKKTIGDLNVKESSVIVAGDSYANQYAYGLDNFFKDNHIKADTLFAHGCLISRDSIRTPGTGPDNLCSGQYGNLYNLLKGNSKPLIISHSWDTSKDVLTNRKTGEKIIFKDKDEYYSYVIEQLKLLRKDTGGRPLIIIGSPPRVGDKNGVVACITRPSFATGPCSEQLNVRERAAHSYKLNQMLKTAAQSMRNTYYMDPYEVFC